MREARPGPRELPLREVRGRGEEELTQDILECTPGHMPVRVPTSAREGKQETDFPTPGSVFAHALRRDKWAGHCESVPSKRGCRKIEEWLRR